jgi:hypothetical protein
MIAIRMVGMSSNVQDPERLEGLRKVYQFTLDRFFHLIRDAQLSLIDINGPRGGSDKMCRIQVLLQPRGALLVKARSDCERKAVKLACEKLREMLVRRLERRRERSRRPA